MRRIVYTCDRCGREIRTSKENPIAVFIDFAMREENDTSLQQPATEEIRNAMSSTLGRDYCYDCVEKITRYLKSVDGESAEERADAMFKENERLRQEIGELTDLKESLIQEVDRANEENACLRGEVEELNGRIADMKLEALTEDAKKAADAAVSSNNKKKSEDRPPKQGTEDAAAKAENPEKPKRERQKREPDAGKIVALAVAGWDTGHIASDMHMDEAEVKNILKRERQRYQ